MRERLRGIVATLAAELPHLATKADLERLAWRLGAVLITAFLAGLGALFAALRWLGG